MNRPKDDLDRTFEKILKEDPSFQEELDKADRAWDIAFQIRDLREKAGLTQKKLAEMVGTKQSNIARIEDADYTRYTLTTLEKVTKALKAKLEIKIIPEDHKGVAYLHRVK
ncbi:helix-turn-helix transcriptional regulator [Candidatus Daviesbacteria bacterium]|nr:helix-turn-helix transcriptional regulator [Candidatus Daviesbacteria bacterium]